MPKASIFDNNQTQVVRVGKSLLIRPEDCSWESFFEGLKADDDFLSDRNQPSMQELEQF